MLLPTCALVLAASPFNAANPDGSKRQGDWCACVVSRFLKDVKTATEKVDLPDLLGIVCLQDVTNLRRIYSGLLGYPGMFVWMFA